MSGDTILIKDISINGNDKLTSATELSKTLTDNTINALGIDTSSRTIWINGQPYGNAYVNINENDVEAPIGAEIFNDFENNIASGEYSHAEGKGTITKNAAEHASGKYNQSNKDTTIFSIGIGESKTNRKNAIEVTQDGDIYVNDIGGYDGKNTSNSKDIATYLPNMVYITYEDLKTLRDNAKLVPGQQYRITNYTCTTSTAGTKSAGHKFDIIVTADSNNKLNEEARAIKHDGDTYFANNNLSAWKIWYCLDNDTNRFAWELGDKKYLGIMYDDVTTKYYEYNSTQVIDGISYYLWRVSDSSFYGTTSIDLNDTCDIIRYIDGSYSVQSQMRGTISDNTGAEGGKGVIYRMIDEFGNDCPYDFKNIQFYREQYENTGLYSIISDATNGTPCYTFSSAAPDSTGNFTDTSLHISNNVYSNVIKEYIMSNKQTLNNTCFFGNNCESNTFGNDCECNSFGTPCKSNTFGNGCSYNIFGNSCYRNTFGNNCECNSFGNECRNNSFGDGCCYNTFRVSASISATLKDHVCYNHFDDGCSYNVIWNSKTTSSTILLKNINVNRGVVGTESSYNMINIDVLNSKQEINVNQFDRIVSIGNILSIKYESLKALRDSDQLIPGRQYRIIDYTCTTSTTGTKSAGNAFDIIVTADSNNKLNEEARAINHYFNNLEDDYFKDCNLSAWKIWYCLDNDTTRFAWADSTNGKGVIYRMIDEFGNDCPYDFKNIQVYRQYDSTTSLWSIPSDNTGVPCYTFSSEGYSSTTSFTDTSLSISNNVYSNVIKRCINFKIQILNNNCFFGTNCYRNTFGNDSENNSFGDNCSNNIFGNNCDHNTFMDSCSNNIFGNMCSNNIFGNKCSYNTFGNRCQYIKFASASSASATKYNYYQYNHFGDGCQRILFIGKETASDFAQVQNYNFSQGINCGGTSYKYIDAELGLPYETRVLEPGATTTEIKEIQ